MSAASSCVRCSKPLAIQSPSGLCSECAATGATPGPTFVPATPAGPDLAAPTRTGPPDGATLSADRGAREAPLPHAPAGYDLLDRLGAGGMGAVYLAREHASERLVAMKFVGQPGNLGAIDRFLIEVRALAGADHPNIVRVFASDFLRADPFFTMEYLPGGSLLKLTSPAEPLSAEKAVGLIRVVADAVAAAHERKVIHRDIKPSNILLAADGTPKVADFGLAKRLDQDDGVTLGSAALGTAPYMPPEQISSKNGELGAWSDVYGLGATLYHLVTGRAPFVGETSEEIIPQVLADPPARPRALRPDIPPALEGIIVKCLEKDPKDRYQTVAELAADLDRYAAKLPTDAPPLTRWRRARQWVRRKRRAVAASALAAIAMACAVALGVILAGGSEKEKPRDYVAEYQRDLKAGKSVTLIPARGLPAWSEQPLGGIQLSTSVAADGACALGSVEQGTLLLLPETGIDQYSVEGEFRELRPAGARPGAEDHAQWCGLLVGYDVNPLPGDGRMHSFFAITFRDYPVSALVGQPGASEHARCYAAGIIEQPNENPAPVLGNAKYRFPFNPSPGQPGEWRKVKFAVAPDRLQAFWWVREEAKTDPQLSGKWERFADLDADGIRERVANTQKTLTKNAPNLGRALPDFAPRKGVAIWCARASFAVRNVVVTPDP